jgi:DNA-binding response OmpR family regulator
MRSGGGLTDEARGRREAGASSTGTRRVLVGSLVGATVVLLGTGGPAGATEGRGDAEDAAPPADVISSDAPDVAGGATSATLADGFVVERTSSERVFASERASGTGGQAASHADLEDAEVTTWDPGGEGTLTGAPTHHEVMGAEVVVHAFDPSVARSPRGPPDGTGPASDPVHDAGDLAAGGSEAPAVTVEDPGDPPVGLGPLDADVGFEPPARTSTEGPSTDGLAPIGRAVVSGSAARAPPEHDLGTVVAARTPAGPDRTRTAGVASDRRPVSTLHASRSASGAATSTRRSATGPCCGPATSPPLGDVPDREGEVQPDGTLATASVGAAARGTDAASTKHPPRGTLAGTGAALLALVVLGAATTAAGGATVATVPPRRGGRTDVPLVGLLLADAEMLARAMEAIAAVGGRALLGRHPPAPGADGPFTTSRPEVVVADARLLGPSGDGGPVLDARRAAVPIVVLRRSGDDGPVVGASATLPASARPDLIAAQLLAVLEARRSLDGSDRTLELRLGPFRYLPGRRAVDVDGSTVRCSPAQTAMLVQLLRAGGGVVPGPALGSDGTDRRLSAASVAAQLRRLRHRLDELVPGLGRAVVTVRGVGYRVDTDRARTALAGSSDARAGDTT